jgi:peptidoglycan/xylan/chitin deacetylase (PgdA/CDA1 family)
MSARAASPARRALGRLLGGRTRLALARVAGHLLRASGLRAGLVVVYHGVHPDARPWLALPSALPVSRLAAELRQLRGSYAVVPASGIVEAAAGRRRGQRFPVAVTFDDDLASHAQLAAPELRALGLPASFFLCGASLDGPFCFWWERLARLPAGAATGEWLDRAVGRGAGESLDAASAAIERLSPADRDAVASALLERAGPDPPDAGMRVGDVRALAQDGFELGFHTLRHHPLTGLDDAALATALEEGRDRLAAAGGRPLSLLAYPHGRADARVADAARRAGYRRAFTADAVAVRPADDPLRLGRMHGGGPTLGHFALGLVRALVRARSGPRPRREERVAPGRAGAA